MSSQASSSQAGNCSIDIHHHFLPPFFVDALAKAGHAAAGQAEALAWSPEASLAMMDDAGIETAIVSLSLPGISFEGSADPATLARRCNEYAAQMVADHPGRFGAFASLPMLQTQAALDEMTYALDNLKLDGVMLLSNVRGRYLDDERFTPLLTELNRRRAIVFLHPNHAPSPGFNDFVEFPHEVTRALAALTVSGGLERFTRIRYILAYAGGTIPFIASRVTVVGMDVFGSILKTLLRYLQRVRTMRRMNYDLTASTDPYAWRALSEHTKPHRILTGSNFPWTSPAAFARQKAGLQAAGALDSLQLASIECGNARKLFARFA
jgi:predicted TIM-barrel fold metal-dependent hydrolase